MAVLQRFLALFGFLWLPGVSFIKKKLMKTDYFVFPNSGTLCGAAAAKGVSADELTISNKPKMPTRQEVSGKRKESVWE